MSQRFAADGLNLLRFSIVMSCAVLGFMPSLLAEEPVPKRPATVIAVVDEYRALKEHPAYAATRAEDVKRAKEKEAKQAKVREEYKAFEKLPPGEERDKMAEKLHRDRIESQKSPGSGFVPSAEQELKNVVRKATRVVTKRLGIDIVFFATSNGFDTTSSTLGYNQSVDITDEVIKELKSLDVKK